MTRARVDESGGIKCWKCGVHTAPSSKPNYSNVGILRTRTGGAIELNTPAKLARKIDGELEAPRKAVEDSLAYQLRSNESVAERAAILEYEGGLSRKEAEHEAAKELGFSCENPNTLMNRIIEEDPTLLHKESPFAGAITQLTRPTILSEWHVGLSNDKGILFWYVDHKGRFRNAKKIWYEPNGWNRLRDDRHTPHFLYKGNPVPIYGEWQLTQYERRPFALFESEKTAIVASVHLPQYVCLAMGGHELKDERKASILHGRTGIILFDREPETTRAAKEAARTLHKIGANASVENLERFYPGIPPHWDAADIIYHQFQEWKQRQLL